MSTRSGARSGARRCAGSVWSGRGRPRTPMGGETASPDGGMPLLPGILQVGNRALAEGSGAVLAVAPRSWAEGCPTLDAEDTGPNGFTVKTRTYLDPLTGEQLLVELLLPDESQRSFECTPARWSRPSRGRGLRGGVAPAAAVGILARMGTAVPKVESGRALDGAAVAGHRTRPDSKKPQGIRGLERELRGRPRLASNLRLPAECRVDAPPDPTPRPLSGASSNGWAWRRRRPRPLADQLVQLAEQLPEREYRALVEGVVPRHPGERDPERTKRRRCRTFSRTSAPSSRSWMKA